MAFDPTVGTEGRVRYGGGNSALDGAMEWRITKTLTPVPVNHFELTADADGVLWTTYESGLATATATVRGIYNVDGTLKTEGGTPAIRIGQTVTLDLLFTRSTPFGYMDLSALVTGFEAGTSIENQLGTYTATFTIKGAAASASL